MKKLKRNIGKEIKDVGTLLIIIGVVFALAFLYLLVCGEDSALGYIIGKHFLFVVFGGLLSLLFGVIIRSIGKTKEAKFNLNNKQQ